MPAPEEKKHSCRVGAQRLHSGSRLRVRLLFCANSSDLCAREARLPALEILTQLIRRPQTKAYVLTPSSMPHT